MLFNSIRFISTLNKKNILHVFTILISLFLIYSCSEVRDKTDTVKIPSRIISMAPSITETICALSLQDRLVGVSLFCKYPEEVSKLPVVGGYINPNYEQILKLKPDLVILLEGNVNVIEFLQKHRIGYLEIDNDNCSSILNSFIIIAEKCGERARGDSLAEEIRNKLYNVPQKLNNKPKILICIGRNDVGHGKIGKVFVAGQKSFYDELINASGGTNACMNSKIAYPTMTVEGIVRLEPDIIIDCSSSMGKVSEKSIVDDWASLDLIKAVKTGDVYNLSDDYITIPGPRIVLIVENISSIVNHWNQKNE